MWAAPDTTTLRARLSLFGVLSGTHPPLAVDGVVLPDLLVDQRVVEAWSSADGNYVGLSAARAALLHDADQRLRKLDGGVDV